MAGEELSRAFRPWYASLALSLSAKLTFKFPNLAIRPERLIQLMERIRRDLREGPTHRRPIGPSTDLHDVFAASPSEVSLPHNPPNPRFLLAVIPMRGEADHIGSTLPGISYLFMA